MRIYNVITSLITQMRVTRDFHRRRVAESATTLKHANIVADTSLYSAMSQYWAQSDQR